MLQKRFCVKCADGHVKVRVTALEASHSKRTSRREARKLLKRIPKATSIDGPFKRQREFYKAVLDRELPHYFLCRLYDFEKRDDELPERLTSSVMRAQEKKSPLKCNTVSILGLGFTLEVLVAQKLVKDSSVLEGINAYLNHQWKAKQPPSVPEEERRTTPEEISLMNGTIALVKKHLIEEYACKATYNRLHYALAALLHLQPPKNSPTPRWRARRSLKLIKKSNPHLYVYVRPFYESVINNRLPQHYYDELKKRRNYSDDLPFHEDAFERLELALNHPEYPFLKCRGNTIVGIGLKLTSAIDERIIKDPSVIAAILDFRQHDWNAFKGKGKYWTTPAEIEYINKTLDLVIDCLKRTYNL